MTTERDIYGFGTSVEREASRRYARQFRRRPREGRPELQDRSLVETGFYGAQPGLAYTGTPETVAERDFIIDFINQYGGRPGRGDIIAFQRTQGYELDESRVYAPGSLQAQMGFRTGADYLRAQQAQQTYGPFAGERVPFGGLVTYDPATGQPLTRTFEPTAAVRRGEFIPPPGGLGVTQQNVFGQLSESQYYQDYTQGARPGPGEFYPSAGQVTFQAPTLQQAEQQGLIQTDPIDLYAANLFDYLDANLGEPVDESMLREDMTPEQRAEVFRRQGAITQEQYDEAVAEAEAGIRKGIFVRYSVYWLWYLFTNLFSSHIAIIIQNTQNRINELISPTRIIKMDELGGNRWDGIYSKRPKLFIKIPRICG
ncbi:hypothetical protein LCGC14_1970770, partial [marine sediment metagenome]